LRPVWWAGLAAQAARQGVGRARAASARAQRILVTAVSGLTRRLMLGSQGADGTVTPQPMAMFTRRRWTSRK